MTPHEDASPVPAPSPTRIGLIGTFDVENFGDCMFPELYAHLLRERLGEIEIALYSPTARAAEILSFDRVEALPDRAGRAALARLDADRLILIGGETVGHGHSPGTFNFPRGTLSAYLRLWLAPILAARDPALRPTFFAAHCVGAVRRPEETCRLVAEALSAADRVRFRDRFSAEWIRSGGRAFGVDTDPMFLIDGLLDEADWSRRAAAHLPEGMHPGGYLAAQRSVGYGGDDLGAWARAVAEIARPRGLPVVLVPICHFMEDEVGLERARPLLEAEGLRVHLARGRVDVKDTAALVGMSAGYVGSSLHGAVTSVAFARPLAVLGHAPDGKHEGTLRSVGLPGLTATDPGALPDRFARSEALDRDAARAHAQDLARASIDGLAGDMAAGRSEAEPSGLEAAAGRLIEAERRIAPAAEAKRIALRAVRRMPVLSRAYRRYRLARAFGRG